MVQSRRELIDALVDDVTRAAVGSAERGPEDRVVARQRVEKAIQRAAERAHGDVVALAHGDSHSPDADRFSTHMNSSYQEPGGPDPAVRDSAAGRYPVAVAKAGVAAVVDRRGLSNGGRAT